MKEAELDKRILAVTNESAEALAYLKSYVVETPEDYTNAAAMVQTFKGQFDALEAERRELTDPLNATIKKINEKVKPATTFLDTAIRLLKAAMGAFQIREEERQRKALEEAAELAKSGEVAAATVALARVESEMPKVAGMTSREDWDFEITDESKLPREFLQPNEKAIRAFIKAAKKPDAIPGVRAFAKKVISTRGAA
jgi:hypothetical protein